MNGMKSLLKISLLLLLPAFSIAQQNPYWEEWNKEQADSLQLIFYNSANDTIRMGVARSLGFYYQELNTDSALYFHKKQAALAGQLKAKLWEADALENMGYVLSIQKNYPQSLKAFLTAITIAEDKETEKNIWQVSRFSKAGDPTMARLVVLAFSRVDLGRLYGYTGNVKEELSNSFEALKIAERVGDPANLANINENIGLIFIRLNQPDSALTFEKKALAYTKTSGLKKFNGQLLNFFGAIYLKKANYLLAKQYFTDAIRESQQPNNSNSLALAYLGIGEALSFMGDTDSSLWYAKRGLEISEISQTPDLLTQAYTSLSSIYKLRNNMDSAFFYQGLAMAEKDSINSVEKLNQFQNIGFDEQLKVQALEKEKIENQNKIKSYSMLAGIVVFMLIAFLLHRNNRNRQKANALLQKQKEELQSTLSELKSAQSQLIQSEKMASLGELTAGIAHEIQNPLNFVNNFSEVNTELIDEAGEEMNKGNISEAKIILNDIKENEQKINHHGKRADAIVKGMLQHSQSSTGKKEPTNINALTDEYLRLSYHGLLAKDKTFNAILKTDFDESIGNINIIPHDIGRVLLNLYNNAFYAVQENQREDSRERSTTFEKWSTLYEPTISISTKKVGEKVEIKVRDNGNGIPQKILDKIFQPFFTTKPTGQGTGLGLSLAYDIIKAHGGELKVETLPACSAAAEQAGNAADGTTFIILLPIV
jgi:two-component system, NtrC family, sensor kinase